MATATVTTVEIPQAPVIPPPLLRERIVLELSPNEAEALALILGKVGGDPKRSRRKYVDEIYNALSTLGISTGTTDGGGSNFAGQTALMFLIETLDPSKD